MTKLNSFLLPADFHNNTQQLTFVPVVRCMFINYDYYCCYCCCLFCALLTPQTRSQVSRQVSSRHQKSESRAHFGLSVTEFILSPHPSKVSPAARPKHLNTLRLMPASQIRLRISLKGPTCSLWSWFVNPSLNDVQ